MPPADDVAERPAQSPTQVDDPLPADVHPATAQEVRTLSPRSPSRPGMATVHFLYAAGEDLPEPAEDAPLAPVIPLRRSFDGH